ncbi:hypothetical protein BpHYR1_008125 [Brachionus plicatilis]|uniref:Uncharacterized protein n=1 Tax=Brachionus plicatilis TaxID=10195 RepID=A0A3M7R309_BRAPC|nr:hypothetical protein BpHYR1_008125 [Brachionus plicatilis]
MIADGCTGPLTRPKKLIEIQKNSLNLHKYGTRNKAAIAKLTLNKTATNKIGFILNATNAARNRPTTYNIQNKVCTLVYSWVKPKIQKSRRVISFFCTIIRFEYSSFWATMNIRPTRTDIPPATEYGTVSSTWSEMCSVGKI